MLEECDYSKKEKVAKKPKSDGFTSRIVGPIVLIVLGGIFIALSIFTLWPRYVLTHTEAAPPDLNDTIIISMDTPIESKPSLDQPYSVLPNQPRRIIIPSIDVEGYVQKVGTDQYSNVAVPTNIHFAGWFTSSVKPGDLGLSVIDGHVSGRYRAAIFERLSELNKGDSYKIEFGDLSQREFVVIDKIIVSEQESSKQLFNRVEGVERQLNLITCGGKFDSVTDTFKDRVIIISEFQGI